MTDSLLNDTQADKVQIDETKNYLTDLVGEGKKFKDTEALARGKYEADLTVETLKGRLDDLRNDYLEVSEQNKSRAKLEDLMDQLKTQQSTNSNNTNAKETTNDRPDYDPKQIESLVSSKIQEHEVSKKQNENFNMVKGRLRERFGNSYPTVLKQQIDALGLTDEFVDDLARKHPAVLFKTLGLDSEESRENFQTPPKSSQRSDNFAPTTKKRTWQFYQNMRKENPTLYHKPETAVHMVEDYKTLGRDFEDGDFKSL